MACPICGGKPYKCCNQWFDESGIREHLTERMMVPEVIEYHIKNPDCSCVIPSQTADVKIIPDPWWRKLWYWMRRRPLPPMYQYKLR